MRVAIDIRRITEFGVGTYTRNALRTLARLEELAATPDRPFFLECSFPDPHHPFTPPGHYFDCYRASDMPLPATWQVDPAQAPPHVRHLYAERDAGNAIKNTPMLFACARCVRLYGQGCCCLKCNQLCQKLEAPVDKKISEVAEPDLPPTVH